MKFRELPPAIPVRRANRKERDKELKAPSSSSQQSAANALITRLVARTLYIRRATRSRQTHTRHGLFTYTVNHTVRPHLGLRERGPQADRIAILQRRLLRNSSVHPPPIYISCDVLVRPRRPPVLRNWNKQRQRRKPTCKQRRDYTLPV